MKRKLRLAAAGRGPAAAGATSYQLLSPSPGSHHKAPAESFAFWDHGLELSRRFRALKLWMTSRYYGGRPAGIRIDRLDSDLAARLLRATDLRGEDRAPTRQYHVVHAYVRTAWQEPDDEGPDRLDHWDADGRLYPCVQLSRFVRDKPPRPSTRCGV